MSDIYWDEPLKYLSQTPQRQRDEIHRLQGEVEALRRELAACEQRNLSLEVFAPQIDKLEDTERQLAASQAREQQLREALDWICANGGNFAKGQEALALPHNTDALKQYGAKLLREATSDCALRAFETTTVVEHLRRMADELEKS